MNTCAGIKRIPSPSSARNTKPGVSNGPLNDHETRLSKAAPLMAAFDSIHHGGLCLRITLVPQAAKSIHFKASQSTSHVDILLGFKESTFHLDDVHVRVWF